MQDNLKSVSTITIGTIPVQTNRQINMEPSTSSHNPSSSLPSYNDLCMKYIKFTI